MDLDPSVPSLVDLATHRIAVQVLAEYEIKQWPQRYFIAKRKIRTLNIPTRLEKMVAQATYSVGLKIKLCHMVETDTDEEESYVRSWNRRLCWNVDGSVDKAETALLLARDRRMNVKWRYRVACAYCLEDLMDSLWEEMSDEEQDLEYNSFRFDRSSRFFTSFWTALKRGREKKLIKRAKLYKNYTTVDHFGFWIGTELRNEVAMGFFWDRLNQSQKAWHLQWTSFGLPTHSSNAIFPFMWAKLDRQKQMKLFATQGFRVLNCLLSCGRLDLFSKAAPLCLPHLSPGEYVSILKDMASSGTFSFEILSNLWKSAPPDYRSRFVTASNFSNSIFHFVINGDEDIVQMLLNEVAAANRNNIISNMVPSWALDCTIRNGNWPMLEFLAYGLITSPEGVCRLRSKLKSVCETMGALDPVLEEFHLQVKPKLFGSLTDMFKEQ